MIYVWRYKNNHTYIFRQLDKRIPALSPGACYGPRGHVVNKFKQYVLYFDLVVMCPISSCLSVVVKFRVSKMSSPFVLYEYV